MEHIDTVHFSYPISLIYQLWHVNCRVYDSACNLMHSKSPNSAEDELIFSSENVATFRNIYQKNDIPMVFEGSNNILIATFMLSQGAFCLIGPFSYSPLSKEDKKAFLHHYKIRNHEYVIPVIPIDHVYQLLQTSCYLLTQREYTTEDLMDFIHPVERSEDQLSMYRLDNALEERKHLTYEYEMQWLRAIEDGTSETPDPSTISFSIVSDQVGDMSAGDAKKQFEYSYVSGITLMTRAIMRGGVSPYEAYALSDIYLQRLTQCKNVLEMNIVFLKAQSDMTKAVRDKKATRNTNIYVEQAKDYVGLHLHDKFSVADIAAELGITESYLSRICSQTMDTTLREYIMDQRLIAAANLLKYSPSSIAQIAEYMCFSSPSHFGTYFQRKYHMTPSAYRKKYRVTRTWD